LAETILNLTEKPLTYKVGIGSEPISNTIWGLDGTYSTEVPFLTKLVDAIPLINTKAPSKFTFTGEFAHLIPGHSRAIDKTGTSYIDDFEGTQTSLDLKSAHIWVLASTPAGTKRFAEAKRSDSIIYGFNRAHLAWYYINSDLLRSTTATPSHITKDDQSNHLVREVYEKEIFPNKESPNGIPTYLPILNLAYYPSDRGPYNYDITGVPGISAGVDALGRLKNPRSRWAGVMRQVHTNDFEAANIEYIEFWVMDPFVYNKDHSGGELYFNLGHVSEDILKDGRKSFENGLPYPPDATMVDTTHWGVVSKKQFLVNAFDNNPDARAFSGCRFRRITHTRRTSFL
jgi:cell surface protein SprA